MDQTKLELSNSRSKTSSKKSRSSFNAINSQR
jgi:hypothetical protein